MAQLASITNAVKALAPAASEETAADEGAFDLVLAALTPDLAAPQAPTPLPKTSDVKAAPEPAPKDGDIVKLLPRPTAAGRPADIKLPVPAKLAAPKPDVEQIGKPASPPSTDDKDGVAVAPVRLVPPVAARPAPEMIAAEAAKPPVAPVVEAPAPQIPALPVEAAVPPPVEAKPETRASAKPNVAVLDKTPRPAPQPIVQDATPVQEIEHDAPSASQEPAAPEPAQPQQPPAPAPAPQAVQAVQAATATHTQQAAAASTPAPEHAVAHEGPQPDIKALAAQIVAKAASGTKSFEIRLDPPELGRVEVRLTVSHDGKAEATLTAERPETVALLQRDSQNLERTLKDAGLDVSNSSLNFSLKGEERQGDGGGASRAHTRNLSDAVVARSEAANASLANRSSAPSSACLDIFV